MGAERQVHYTQSPGQPRDSRAGGRLRRLVGKATHRGRVVVRYPCGVTNVHPQLQTAVERVARVGATAWPASFPRWLGRATMRLGCVPAAMILAGAGGAVATARPAGDPPAVPAAVQVAGGSLAWQELRYSAAKFLLRASTVIRVDEVDGDTLRPGLRQPMAGDGVALPPRVLVVGVDTDLPFGRSERVAYWLDPATGAAVQGEKLALGGKPYRKVFRYLADGLEVWRLAPANDGERAGDPAAWTSSRTASIRPVHPFPPGAVVTDAYALLPLASAARLDEAGATATLYFISDDQPVRLDLTAGKLTLKRPGQREIWPGGERVQRGDVLVRTVTVHGRVVGDASVGDKVDLGFMGMRGELRMYLEVGTGIPVEIVGRADHVGEITVGLDRVTFRQAPEPAAARR